jgi:hypothetical protein
MKLKIALFLLKIINWCEFKRHNFKKHTYSDTQWACTCCNGKVKQWYLKNSDRGIK